MCGLALPLQVLADDEYGLAVQVAACNYAMREPATRYQPWVEVMVQQYGAFGRAMASSGLTPEVQLKVGPGVGHTHAEDPGFAYSNSDITMLKTLADRPERNVFAVSTHFGPCFSGLLL